MGGSSEDLEQVVGSFDAAVGGAAGVVPGEYLVGPGDDGVDDAGELGEFAGGVEVVEPVECLQGAGLLVGEVETVEFLGGLGSRF